MNNYIKGFGFSFIVHSAVIFAFVIFAAGMAHTGKPKIVVDLSAVLIERPPVIEEPTVTEPPPPEAEPLPPPPEIAPPLPKPVVKKDSVPKPAKPAAQEVVPDAVRYVDATEESVAPAEPSYTAAGTATEEDAADQQMAYAAAQGRLDDEMRRGYVGQNFGYIQKHIRDNLVYPPKAKRMGLKGKVTLRFTISSNGTVSNVCVEKTSGHEMLDLAAMDAVNTAAPFPKPPISAQIIIPIDFKLM